MARGQLMNRCSPPMRRIASWPGRRYKVIGVAENDLGAQRFQHVLWNGLHRPGSPYRHEDRSFDGPVRQKELRAAPSGLGVVDQAELEGH